jgi:cathepsin F/cysteine peptidase B
MKIVLLFAIIAAATADQWGDYKSTYGRRYSTVAEEQHRQACFETNLRIIAQRNLADTALHGINKFTDLCADEFKVYHNLKVDLNKTRNEITPFTKEEVAASLLQNIDWRAHGAVTVVKDQGQCGSCWSFSATGNMEGQWKLAGHPLVSISEQALVSCDHVDSGCNGGLMDNAFQWAIQNGGLPAEATYPYTSGNGVTGACISSKMTPIVAKFTSYKDVPRMESQLQAQLVKGGPVAIAVDATSFQTYHSGIMSNCQFNQLDHGVLAVGFGTALDGSQYWIVKNSWASTWGENGYIRLKYGSNQCGLTNAASTIVA